MTLNSPKNLKEISNYSHVYCERDFRRICFGGKEFNVMKFNAVKATVAIRVAI
jgi:hypothetical protein